MKRSEVQYIISNFLYQLNVDSEDADRLGDELLTQLEKVGMLPPEVDVVREGHDCTENIWEKE